MDKKISFFSASLIPSGKCQITGVTPTPTTTMPWPPAGSNPNPKRMRTAKTPSLAGETWPKECLISRVLSNTAPNLLTAAVLRHYYPGEKSMKEQMNVKIQIWEKSSSPSIKLRYCPLQKWDLLSVVASGRIRDRDSLPEVANPNEVHL